MSSAYQFNLQFQSFMEEYKWPIIIFMIVIFSVMKRARKVKQAENDIKEQGKLLNNDIIRYVLNDNVEAIKKKLEQRGYGGNFIARTGESALEIAIINKNKYMIAYLIKYGATPLPKDLKTAMASNDSEIIEMIKTGKHLKVIKEYELLTKKTI
ncbi:hypothetical protein [Peribacillus simplex]|uniref:hypothetical protein n=1 Tax=Peribacillus simplex TaxID=1478 RepID=UPI00333DAF67